jgi:ABC-type bacteriocin/lantibiotic exporter with double-glycine peptidase domain
VRIWLLITNDQLLVSQEVVVDVVPPSWPSEGRVEFASLRMAYPTNPDNPIFKSLSFTVDARTRVGIVGYLHPPNHTPTHSTRDQPPTRPCLSVSFV